MKIIYPSFLTRRMVGGDLVPEILGQTDRDGTEMPILAKMPIFNRYLPIVPRL